jgi:hypothetical protein
MSAQFEFAMHPRDEAIFADALLADPLVQLIDGPRWKNPEPALGRALSPDDGDHLLIWPGNPVPRPTARLVPTAAGDWYCDAEASTLQWLRSRLDGNTLTTGRVALHYFPEDYPEAAGKRVTALFNRLRRVVKAGYTNSVVCWANPRLPFAPAGDGRSANPSAPDPRLWVGPQALAWLRESPAHAIRQFAGGFVEGRPVAGAG